MDSRIRTCCVLAVLSACLVITQAAVPHDRAQYARQKVLLREDDNVPVSWDLDDSMMEPDNVERIEGDIIPSPDLLKLIEQEENDEKSAGEEWKDDESKSTNTSSGDLQRPAKRSRRALLRGYIWPKGVVPYAYGVELSLTLGDAYFEQAQKAINNAMKRIEAKSCVRFQRVTCTPGVPCVGNYIKFMPVREGDRFCSSFVGRQRGIMPVRIGPMCIHRVGMVVHELLHVLGFHHEQSRPDRDEYITILKENIVDYEKNNISFRKYSRGRINSMNDSYDLDSIMHYENRAFSKDPERLSTIVAKHQPNKRLGQREAMSESDIKQLNLLYNCPKDVYSAASRPCASQQPLEYRKTFSMQYKTRKWMYCDQHACRRKSCLNLTDSTCESEPQGCQEAKFRMLPNNPSGEDTYIRDGDRVRVVHAKASGEEQSVNCGVNGQMRCSMRRCQSGDSVCHTNTFTLRKPAAEERSVVVQNDIISLCRPEQEARHNGGHVCVSCSRPVLSPNQPCRLVSCTQDLKKCDGIFFRARQWPQLAGQMP